MAILIVEKSSCFEIMVVGLLFGILFELEKNRRMKQILGGRKMRKGYFFINGKLLDKDTIITDGYELELDYKYKYQIENFGVSRDFNNCKYNAINDVITDTKGNRKIIPNTYIAILEIGLRNSDYNSIDEKSLLADFDILERIKNSDYKLVYSGMFDNDEKFIENFIVYN